jgi:FkbM family methyltransferase
MQIKRLLPLGAKLWAKEKATGLMSVPWNRFGLPTPLANRLPRDSEIVIIDVGASRGDFTSIIDKWCGIRKALLIEPQPARVNELRKRFYGPRFSFEQAAAASTHGRLEMEILNWDYSSSILPVRRDMPHVSAVIDHGVRETVAVSTMPLDYICESRKFEEPIDLLKIDVQGAEHAVILGASKTLKRVHMIWMELSLQPLYEGSQTIEAMIRLCRDSGFVLKHLEDGFCGSNGEVLQVDSLFARNG